MSRGGRSPRPPSSLPRTDPEVNPSLPPPAPTETEVNPSLPPSPGPIPRLIPLSLTGLIPLPLTGQGERGVRGSTRSSLGSTPDVLGWELHSPGDLVIWCLGSK